jgi:hypothetical protein
MKKLLIPFVLVLAACGGGSSQTGGTRTVPGHGAISVEVVPNPIRATQVSGQTYDFPFEVVIRETGGRAVNVTRVSVNVTALGGISVHRESWDADRIRSMGYATNIPANGEVRYRFSPRKEVPDDRLFGGVNAQLTVDGADDAGMAASAATTVTVTR